MTAKLLKRPRDFVQLGKSVGDIMDGVSAPGEMLESPLPKKQGPMLQFAEPIDVADPSECAWYQTFDWPDGSVVKGRWDYRQNVDAYLGRIDYRGKTVIEVGPASGYLTRAMEQRGADVVCIDLDPLQAWEIVPRLDRDVDTYYAKRRRGMPVVRKAWWLSRKIFNGTAKLSECGASALFEIRNQLSFDIGFVGSVLQHFESPYRVLSALASVCKMIVVTELLLPRLGQLCEFMPAAKNNNLGSWWALSPFTVDRMMETLNFAKIDSYTTTFRRYDMKSPKIKDDGFADFPFYTHVYEKRPRDEAAFQRIQER